MAESDCSDGQPVRSTKGISRSREVRNLSQGWNSSIKV
jgi:hypothetical protein